MRNTAFAMLLVSAALQGCGYPGMDGRRTIAGDLQSEMAEIRHRIAQEIRDATAQREQQCRVLALGEKACGGPQAFLAYSTGASDERKLLELARQYAEAEQKYNRVTGAMSTCSYLMPPGVRLEKGQCTISLPPAGAKLP
ncbi:MAG TPA: hypothetical protein VIM12_12485 [Noviherbaspirillum sp.]|jgi:hypothetical protein|uniref:hypothetical protein n=1 Tax=Noviherbaspirillum sp. TaxID=1926288 RepID=UPI002F92ED7F